MTRVGSVLCPVIVGRDDLLELVDELIAEAVQGRGHTLFLSGRAGLGKTRLIRAAVRKAEAAGVRVEGGGVAPQDREVPLASIREMANSMRENPAFGSLGPDLLAMDGAHSGDALGSRRLLVRGAADRILEAIDRPTMLVFDDLHWTDEMSLEVIGELARHATERPLFLLAGYRADEFPADSLHREWRARMLSQRDAREARLQPLTLEQTGVATTLILGGQLPAPRDVVEAVHERTNGIPLHIEELLGALDDDARTDGRRIREARVPDTIGDAVLARLARLSDDARLVARAAAVVGRCFSPDMMAGMVDRPLAELEPTIEELVDASILYPFDYIDQGYYDFRHQLLRDAVYGTLSPAMLRRFHAQAAEFGMTLEGASVIHASRHYERAGLRSQAFRAAMTGATEASRISARHEAYELYRRAIDNMPPDVPVGEQAELYERFTDAAAAIERNEDSVAAATRARELYQLAGRPLGAAGMLSRCRSRRPATGRRKRRPAHSRSARSTRSRTCRRDRSVSRSGHSLLSMRANDAIARLGPDGGPRRRRGGAGAGRGGRRPRDGPGGRPDPGPDRYRRRPPRDGPRRRHARRAGGTRSRIRVGRRDRVSQHRDDGRPDHGPQGRGAGAPRRAPVRRRDRAVALPPDDGDDGRAPRLGRRSVGRGRRARPP